MPNVHHISKAQPTEIEYHGEHIEITYREKTKDYAYSFVITRKMPFTGHAQNYDNCVDDAKQRVNQVTGS